MYDVCRREGRQHIKGFAGGHINPAVSLMFLSFRQLAPVRFILYTLVQTAGAFVGSALSYALYHGTSTVAIRLRAISAFNFQRPSTNSTEEFGLWSVQREPPASSPRIRPTIWAFSTVSSIRFEQTLSFSGVHIAVYGVCCATACNDLISDSTPDRALACPLHPLHRQIGGVG